MASAITSSLTTSKPIPSVTISRRNIGKWYIHTCNSLCAHVHVYIWLPYLSTVFAIPFQLFMAQDVPSIKYKHVAICSSKKCPKPIMKACECLTIHFVKNLWHHMVKFWYTYDGLQICIVIFKWADQRPVVVYWGLITVTYTHYCQQLLIMFVMIRKDRILRVIHVVC